MPTKNNPDLQHFLKESGFKLLAFARLSQCGYSLILYVLNCSVSGLDQIITTEGELAALIGYSEKDVREALTDLAQRHMIRLHFSDHSVAPEKSALRLGIQYDISKWELYFEDQVSSKDAVVFPFRRLGAAVLQVFDGQKGEKHDKSKDPTWQRIVESFIPGRNLDAKELKQSEEMAKVLIETHPVDQVLLMIRHFEHRIPTLSLLASSWQHYQELFEEETQKVDLLGARQKHHELDDRLRERVSSVLEKSSDLGLSEEELGVLRILQQHRHPRRQLFWAYQLRSRYPKLADFFHENASYMLSVTTSGSVVKRPHE